MRPVIGLLTLSLCVSTLARAEAPVPRRPAPPTPPGPAPTAAIAKDPLANASLLAPIQVQSLTITPIVSAGTEQQPEVAVLTLDEAMDTRKVKIREAPNEDVNNLVLVNQSNQPLFVLAGEVILGGKQDRIIGSNTVIPAKTTQTVPVFCVEHGRWDNSGKTFKSARALAHGRLRGKASFEEQGAVWQEVAAKNAARKTTNKTDTYRTVAQQQQNGTLKVWEQQVDEALAKVRVTDRTRMVGYVVAINGKVATVDMFESPALFKKLEGKLVKSYVTEAIDIAATKDAKPPTAAQVKEFMDDAEAAPAERGYDTRASTTMTKKGMKTGKAEVMMKPPGNAAPAADAKPMYKTYQAK
ncbi:MAG: hypothetical protein H0X17_16890 [Deltaproteobacteria bacterium]|nr:hypothetical protein [Deltaproteobacteria bacterium]